MNNSASVKWLYLEWETGESWRKWLTLMRWMSTDKTPDDCCEKGSLKWHVGSHDTKRQLESSKSVEVIPSNVTPSQSGNKCAFGRDNRECFALETPDWLSIASSALCLPYIFPAAQFAFPIIFSVFVCLHRNGNKRARFTPFIGSFRKKTKRVSGRCAVPLILSGEGGARIGLADDKTNDCMTRGLDATLSRGRGALSSTLREHFRGATGSSSRQTTRSSSGRDADTFVILEYPNEATRRRITETESRITNSSFLDWETDGAKRRD